MKNLGLDVNVRKQILPWLLWVSPLFFAGCTMFGQKGNMVLIRDPGNRMYNPPVNVAETATSSWEYAVLSENVYLGEWKAPTNPSSEQPTQAITPKVTDENDGSKQRHPLPLTGWQQWSNFPWDDLINEARETGLYFEVWEKESSPPVIAVVFRGTEASWLDWKSNLRWFLRFIPFYPDQYTVVAQKVGKKFIERLGRMKLEAQGEDRTEVTIIATGHSLGGGLAQHFAYSLPGRTSEGTELPRVSQIYAFNPSPVTGWFSVDDTEQRDINAKELKIDRIFEHGEILAYIRLLLSYVYPPPDRDPSVREVRYNFVESWNPFASHSMRQLACKLSQGAKPTEGSTEVSCQCFPQKCESNGK